MRQPRICRCLKSQCQHPSETATNFLSLPSYVRDNVYQEAGLFHGTTVRLMGRGPPPFHTVCAGTHISLMAIRLNRDVTVFCAISEPLGRLNWWDGYELHSELNACSSLVATDVARFLWSHNDILVCCQDVTDIEVLLHVAPIAFFLALRKLTIHLTLAPARHLSNGDDAEDGMCIHTTQFKDINQRTAKSEEYETLAQAWYNLAKRLAKLRDQGGCDFKLDILCDVENLDQACRFERSIRDQSLELRWICFTMISRSSSFKRRTSRWTKDTKATLRDIAEQCASPKGSRSDTPFPYFALPREPRQHVLAFSDLVTPSRSIFREASGSFTYQDNDYLPNPETGDECRMKEFCGVQSNCATYPPCQCWEPPAPMFMVSKEFSEDAKAVFFSTNAFDVVIHHQEGPDHLAGEDHFFKFRKDELPYLRRLTVIFSHRLFEYLDKQDEQIQLWERSVLFLARYSKGLDLQLDLTHSLLFPSHMRSSVDESWLDMVFSAHKRFVEPLKGLPRLRSCAVRVMPSGQIAFTSLGDYANDQEKMRRHERILEDLVIR